MKISCYKLFKKKKNLALLNYIVEKFNLKNIFFKEYFFYKKIKIIFFSLKLKFFHFFIFFFYSSIILKIFSINVIKKFFNDCIKIFFFIFYFLFVGSNLVIMWIINFFYSKYICYNKKFINIFIFFMLFTRIFYKKIFVICLFLLKKFFNFIEILQPKFPFFYYYCKLFFYYIFLINYYFSPFFKLLVKLIIFIFYIPHFGTLFIKKIEYIYIFSSAQEYMIKNEIDFLIEKIHYSFYYYLTTLFHSWHDKYWNRPVWESWEYSILAWPGALYPGPIKFLIWWSRWNYHSGLDEKYNNRFYYRQKTFFYVIKSFWFDFNNLLITPFFKNKGNSFFITIKFYLKKLLLFGHFFFLSLIFFPLQSAFFLTILFSKLNLFFLFFVKKSYLDKYIFVIDYFSVLKRNIKDRLYYPFFTLNIFNPFETLNLGLFRRFKRRIKKYNGYILWLFRKIKFDWRRYKKIYKKSKRIILKTKKKKNFFGLKLIYKMMLNFLVLNMPQFILLLFAFIFFFLIIKLFYYVYYEKNKSKEKKQKIILNFFLFFFTTFCFFYLSIKYELMSFF